MMNEIQKHSRLIDITPYIWHIDKLIDNPENHDVADVLLALKQMLLNAPEVKVRPLVSAHWILSNDCKASCSNCNADGEPYMDFCPLCGATMHINESGDTLC